MSAKNILRIDKIICTSRPNCPCTFCGRVRLLMAQESERVTRLWDDQVSEDQLALDYIAQFEKGKQ